MNAVVARLGQSSVVHVLVAFVAMGGWAVFANRAHAMPAPVLAGLVQGVMSGAITLVLKRAVEALAARMRGLPALLVPPALAGSLSAGLLTAVHTIGGTPEILSTIALPLAVSTTYAALYSLSLWRGRN